MSYDPRFLRPGRRPERSANRRKQRFRLLLAVAAILCAAAAGLSLLAYGIVAEAGSFRVVNIVIRGAEFAAESELETRIRKLGGGNMLLLNLSDICAAVERHPWIERAHARKVLPDTLQIDVVERAPTLHVLLKGELYLCDNSGLLVDRLRPEHPFIGLPIVRGADELAGEELRRRLAAAGRFVTDLKRAAPAWYDRISEVDVSGGSYFKLALTDREVPILVDEEGAVEELGKYFRIEDSVHKRYDMIEYVDARFKRRLFVKPSPGGQRGQAQ